MSRRAVAYAALSGLLVAASFPTFGLWYLAWIALVPLLAALRDQSVKTGLRLSGIFGLAYFCGTIYWVTNSIHFYGHVPLIPAVLIMLLFSFILALFVTPFGAAVVHLRKHQPGILFLAAPAVWVTLELARTRLFSGFPWALLGHSQQTVLPVIQIADITGAYGVSFLIVLANIAVAEFLADRKKFVPPVVAAAALVTALGYGYFRLGGEYGEGAVKVSVVQGNIEQDKKWDPAYQTEVIDTYKRLTQEAIEQKPDLVIWPETATPFYFGGSGDNARLTADLLQYVKSTRTPLLTGSPTYQVKPGRVIELRNSAFLISQNGTPHAVYHKIHLVPYGEYVPMKKVLFFVEKMVQAIGDFQAGTEYTVMKFRPAGNGREITLSTVICYEIIFPDLVRKFVRGDAGIMTTITNDAWFGRTAAPYQHFSIAVFRAVENRVPLARAANTGVSGFIDAKGRVLETSGIFTEAVLTRTLAPGNVKTFYTKHGDVFAYLCALAGIGLLALPAKEKKS
jgi:apolipoprotein N-acyltransferase